MQKLLCFFLLFYCGLSQVQQKSAPTNGKLLFHGNNLEGWYSFLHTKGKNNDLEKVFTVENGLLHISG